MISAINQSIMYGSEQINQHNDRWPITSSLKLISSVLGTVILGTELLPVKDKLVSLLNSAMDKFKRVGLTYTSKGALYKIELSQAPGVDKQLNGSLIIDLETFACAYDITTAVTMMNGAQNKTGTIQLVDAGGIVESNVREALGKLGLTSPVYDGCCIS
jgi:hypothetical protein